MRVGVLARAEGIEMNVYSLAGMLFGLAIILLITTVFGVIVSGFASTANGAWDAAYNYCVESNPTPYGMNWTPVHMDPNGNPFAIVTGDYKFDCTKDVVTDLNGTLKIETKVLKTIHVQRGLI
jgi:hypothetical protein